MNQPIETRSQTNGTMAAEFNLLIVDDEEYARRALRRLIQIVDWDGPCQVHEAAEGKDALAILRTNPINCVLLDIQMPGGEGDEWLPTITEERPDVPVIMVTGVHDEERAVATMKNGAMDYLVKGSISPWSLQRAILNALEKIKMQAKVGRQREQLLMAERQRTMLESLGAACHHLGQPAAVLNFCLEALAGEQLSVEGQRLIERSTEALGKINNILWRMQRTTTYRTETYIEQNKASKNGDGCQILALVAEEEGQQEACHA